MNENKEMLDEKDRHCILWMIKSSIYTGNPFYGCRYCENAAECAKAVFDDEGFHHAHAVLLKLQSSETGNEDFSKLEGEGATYREKEKISLDYKDLYCLTRHLQDSIYERPMFFGCKCCRYSDECLQMFKEDHRLRIFDLRKKLGEMTGLYLGLQTFETSPLKLATWLQGF